ncbi:MAG TPA: ATP-binding protein [Ktedonobacteraceae bacterium]|nr:ATP-binding protein [Ktedonobacteraceae bacterium]
MIVEEHLTAALLDRLTHRAHILEFLGESFRFRQRLQQGEPGQDQEGQMPAG